MPQEAIYPIILAAGASTRLGFPKALARFGSRTALEIALENVAGLQQAIVVLGSHAQEIQETAARMKGETVVVNKAWRRGQLTSLLVGLTRVPRTADFMLYPVDYPLLTRKVIAQLTEAFTQRNPGQAIAVPSFRGRGGHPVIFAAEMRKELERAQTAREVVYRDESRVKFVAARTAAIWQDLDTPAAYLARMKTFQQRGLAAGGAR